MSDTPEQNIHADDAQAHAGGTDANAELLKKIDLLEANNKKLLAEKGKANASLNDLQEQMQDLRNQQHKAGQERLVKNQEFETLWKDASATNTSLQDEIAQLKQQLEEKDVAFQQQQIKATALNTFSQNGVHSPDHLFQLQKENLRLKDGNVIALVGGVEVDLQAHVESLKSPGSGLDYMFNGSGARGMSAAGTTSTSVGGNSWESMSFSEKLALEVQDPQRFAQLKAQAGA